MAATTEVWDKFPPWVIRIENNENPKEFDPAEKICAIISRMKAGFPLTLTLP